LILYCLAAAYFSAGETALSYCNQVRIRLMADNGDEKAKRVVNLLDRFDETVVALLIGVNILHVVAAAAATVLFIDLMGPAGAGVATLVMTVFIFIFSETIPKSIANVNSDRFLLGTAGIMLFFSLLFRPFVIILTKTGEFFRKLFHVTDKEPSLTEDEFAAIVEEVESEGLLEANETDIIKSSIEFGDIAALKVMTPREKIVAISLHASGEALKELLLSNRFSRYPVYDGDLDHISGSLVAGKALYLMASGRSVSPADVMQEPLLLPNTISASDAFQEMRRSQSHFAVIQSTRGRTLGVITMDDILEELVDDISLIREPEPKMEAAEDPEAGSSSAEKNRGGECHA